MGEKRAVYNGDEEKYMSGSDIKKYFTNAYELTGRHHSVISNYKMNIEESCPKIKDEIEYRLFVNDTFCKVMDSSTDASLYFFGYTFKHPDLLKDKS